MLYKIVQAVCWVFAFVAVYREDYAQANFLLSVAIYTLFYSVARQVNDEE